MNYEAPLTSLVWLTSIVSMVLTFVVSYLLIGGSTDYRPAHPNYWWLLSIIISMGTLAGALIPELVKVFTSTKSAHVKEVVASSKEGGPSLNILSGFVAGNFSAYYIGFAIMVLMGIGYLVSTVGFDIGDGGIMLAPAVFAFGLVAFGFLGMGPVTIAVDSYGPVTDNAQSVYELSTIEHDPRHHRGDQERLRLHSRVGRGQGQPRGERRRRQHLQGDGQAGAHRHGRRGRHHDDLLHHHGAHQWAQGERGQAVAASPAVPAGHHHGRRDDLLVHRRGHPGRHHRRLPRGRVHQEEHQARCRRDQGVRRGQQESGGHLHHSTPRRA